MLLPHASEKPVQCSALLCSSQILPIWFYSLKSQVILAVLHAVWYPSAGRRAVLPSCYLPPFFVCFVFMAGWPPTWWLKDTETQTEIVNAPARSFLFFYTASCTSPRLRSRVSHCSGNPPSPTPLFSTTLSAGKASARRWQIGGRTG